MSFSHVPHDEGQGPDVQRLLGEPAALTAGRRTLRQGCNCEAKRQNF
jgi:hypothetical protein